MSPLYRSAFLSAMLLLLCVSPLYSLIAITSSSSCPAGSAVEESWQTFVYSPIGRLVAAHGVCCDGSTWFKNFGLAAPGEEPGTANSSLNATIVWSSAGYLTVSANAAIELQVIDLRTGQAVSQMYNYTEVNTPLTVNVSSLSASLYGLTVYSNGVPVNLYPFANIGN